jgi:AcrR family transcriptional regulator
MSEARPLDHPEPTRGAILRAAAWMATVDGLDRLSVASVASAMGMSKGAVAAHFGSKLELQLATVEEAVRVFTEEVVQPALAAAPGLPQLAAVCEAFFAHLERRTFPGGSFMASATLEMSTRPGPVGDLIARFQAQFAAMIRGFAATAVDQHELPPGEDPDRLAFEVNGIMLATDTNYALHDDPDVLGLARQIVHQRLAPAEP